MEFLGMIAGTRSLAPLPSLIISGPDDGKVSLKRMDVEGVTEKKEVKATHTFMVRNKKAIQATIDFLESGEF